ncbi:MAG: hypothetical protein WCL00_13725, partial [Bacteroidota bacterium]
MKIVNKTKYSGMLLTLFSWILLFISSSCKEAPKPPEIKSETFIVRDFHPMVNWHIDSTGKEKQGDLMLKSINLDYENAFENGFIIPTIHQTSSGEFEMEFSIRNTGTSSRKFSYKIYYQNESYKFRETDETDSTKQHIYAGENFYGSWDDLSIHFKETAEVPADNEFHKITDHFRIVGNPRNESRYFTENINERWKRNPRVGKYSFLLVVATTEQISTKRIPENLQDIALSNNASFVNPFFWFLHGEGRSLPNTISQVAME